MSHKKAPGDESAPTGAATASPAGRINLRWGWWGLLIFLTAGLALETLHGLKLQFYLNVANAIRREMWTLAHAHGTLLSVVNIAFGLTMQRLLPTATTARSRMASRCLLAALLLLPAGFFIGGIYIYSGDPGFGVVLVPIGGILLLAGVLLAALEVRGART